MVKPAFVFLREDGESNNAAVARCARESLALGPMANTIRGDDYEWFLESSFGRGKQLRGVATSCAIFAGACLIHACVLPRRDWPKVRGITSWLGLGWFGSPTWIPVEKLDPRAGDIFYVCSDVGRTWTRWEAATNGHVGVLVEGDGWEWITAEGGGSPGGTGCRLGATPKDIRKLSRKLRGVWRPDLVPDPHRDTEPAPPPEQ